MDQQPEASSGFQLQDVVAIVRMQWKVVVACTLAGGILALLHGALATRLYRASTVLQLSAVAGQEVQLDAVVDDRSGLWNRQRFMQTQLEVLRSQSLLTDAIESYRSLGEDFDDLTADLKGVRQLREMLEATPRTGTDLLDLAVTADDPEKAAALSLTVAQTYEKRNLNYRRKAAQGAKEWLEDKIADQSARIDDLSSDLVQFQRDESLADVEQNTTTTSAQMDSLNAAYASAKTELIQLQTQVREHEKALRRGNYESLAKSMDTPLVASLGEDWASAVTEHARISARYGEKVPQYRQSRAKLDKIQEELEAEVERTLEAEKAQLAELIEKVKKYEEAIDGGKKVLLDTRASLEQYQKQHMELERAREFYVKLNQRYDELELQAQTQLNNVQILDAPNLPKRPVWPNVPMNLALGLFGGLIAGFGLGIAREFIDDTISSPLEVQTFLRVPFLGLVPKIKEELGESELALYTHENPRSRVAEAMRAVRTVLELNPDGKAPERILVTSAVSSEGKTGTCVRLGVAFANLGKKVLIVDADLRRPRMHRIFSSDKEPGLADLLQGGSDIEASVRQSVVPNLSFMPSGLGGERPNELLASTAMPQLLDRLDDLFDLVIIDSPPSVLLSDARILSRYVNGVVMIVREQTTSRVLCREAVSGLEQIGADVLGVIVNAVDLTHGRTSYKYYYGYGYGYGYGQRYESHYLDAPAETEEQENEQA